MISSTTRPARTGVATVSSDPMTLSTTNQTSARRCGLAKAKIRRSVALLTVRRLPLAVDGTLHRHPVAEIHLHQLRMPLRVNPTSIRRRCCRSQLHMRRFGIHPQRRRPRSLTWAFEWWRGQDLNLRPSGYEPDELPDCSTPRRSGCSWYGPGRRRATRTRPLSVCVRRMRGFGRVGLTQTNGFEPTAPISRRRGRCGCIRRRRRSPPR